jgi:tripartite-type tricarboxylate transporter receptor subunit TctC
MLSQNFIGLFAPAKTPKPIVEQIAQATRAGMADKDYQKMLLASGFEAELDSSPDKTRRFLEEDIGRWTPVIRSTGLKLD